MIWIVLTLVVVLLIVLGPRPRVMLQWVADELPVELGGLANWLAESEQSLGAVTEGAEKHVRFANPAVPAKTPLVVLYLHGFSATRQELAPIPERVAEAIGANYYGARLTGHGLDGESLGKARAGDWLKDTAEAWQIARSLGDRVIVISCSTGGTLSTWLAQQPSAQKALAAMVLFAPNYQPRHWAMKLFGWPWSSYWMRLIAGNEYGWEPAGELNGKYWTHCYPTRVLHELQALVVAVRKSDLNSIRVPSLFLYSTDDQVVSAKYTDRVFDEWGSPVKQRIRIEGVEGESNHVFTGDIVAPHRTDTSISQVIAFLEEQAIVATGAPGSPQV
ncbi:alpha/beta hydrolase [Saccharospirillum impatiens]|uniref:alpha/beta hydrolase n=1 Tax=Saccharospirillum impatiens TaxID=169438 RepID=UPI00041F0493|nr:alpha/beta hydrolase [Saccharospirillum impatiens]